MNRWLFTDNPLRSSPLPRPRRWPGRPQALGRSASKRVRAARSRRLEAKAGSRSTAPTVGASLRVRGVPHPVSLAALKKTPVFLYKHRRLRTETQASLGYKHRRLLMETRASSGSQGHRSSLTSAPIQKWRYAEMAVSGPAPPRQGLHLKALTSARGCAPSMELWNTQALKETTSIYRQ